MENSRKTTGLRPTRGPGWPGATFGVVKILFLRAFEGSSESSDTNPRNLGGRDTCGGMGRRRLKLAAAALTRKWAFGALPGLKGVARVEGISVYTPAVDPDGYPSSIIICSGTPRVKIFNSVSSPPLRRTGLREAGRGLGMGPTKIGRGSWTSSGVKAPRAN